MKKFFKGNLRVEKTEKGYFPLRFTEKQMKYFEVMGEHYASRSRCCGGIKVVFSSFDREILIYFNAENYAREHCTVDIYKNGLLYNHVDFGKNTQNGVLKITKDDDLEAVYTIYFPNTCTWYIEKIVGNIKEVSQNFEKNLLVLGDSISQGMETLYPSMTYTNILEKIKKYNVINQGVGGLYFDSKTLDTFENFKPDIVFIALGTNDIHIEVSEKEIFENIEEYFKRASELYNNSEIFVISPIPVLEAKKYVADRYITISEKIISEAKKYNYHLINGNDLIPKDKNFYFDLTIHPNEVGFFTMTSNILEFLK